MFTDSLTSMQKLQNLPSQRRDFLEWLHGHPEQLFRAKAGTDPVRQSAGPQGHPLNELVADAAASRAAEETDAETAALDHTDSKDVRFVFENRLNEWGAGIRCALTQVAATQFREGHQAPLGV